MPMLHGDCTSNCPWTSKFKASACGPPQSLALELTLPPLLLSWWNPAVCWLCFLKADLSSLQGQISVMVEVAAQVVLLRKTALEAGRENMYDMAPALKILGRMLATALIS